MRVWITKYALTKGIFSIHAEICGSNPIGDMISDMEHTEYGGTYYHGKGRDWHTTLEDAKDRAEAMRTKKIESLNKRIKKLEQLKF